MAALTASACGFAISAPRQVGVAQSVVGLSGISTNLTATSPDAPFNVCAGIDTATISAFTQSGGTSYTNPRSVTSN